MKAQEFALTLTLEKTYVNRPNKASVKRQIGEIKDDVHARYTDKRWAYSFLTPQFDQKKLQGDVLHVVECKFLATYQANGADTPERLRRKCLKIIGETQRACSAKQRKWDVKRASAPGNPELPLDDAALIVESDGQVEATEITLPDDWKPYYKEIYGRDAQIRITWDVLHSFVRSGHRKRSHIVYYGRPSCGKTDVARATANMVEQNSEPGAVLRLSATETTKAGLENLLIRVEPKPSLIIVEEIEKADGNNLCTFLSLLDQRSEVRKTTAYRGQEQVPIHALFIATVNNLSLFKRLLAGALAARFSHKIFFPRPDPTVLKLIGVRDMTLFGGQNKKHQTQCVEKALALLESEGDNDPRRLQALLDGGERLLDGSFQKDQQAIRESLIKEMQEEKDRKVIDPFSEEG